MSYIVYVTIMLFVPKEHLVVQQCKTGEKHKAHEDNIYIKRYKIDTKESRVHK